MKRLIFLTVLLVILAICFNATLALARSVRTVNYYVEELTPEQLEQEKIAWLKRRNKEHLEQICKINYIECFTRKTLERFISNE